MEHTDLYIFLHAMLDFCLSDHCHSEMLTMINPDEEEKIIKLLFKTQESHTRMPVDFNIWLGRYQELQFYELFKLKQETFYKLHTLLMEKDTRGLVSKIFRGGRYPINSEKSLLIFLLYMSTKDTLYGIAERFDVVPSTVFKIINAFLYLVLQLKHVYITWPSTKEELQSVVTGFKTYPNTIGAVDGTHIELKVPARQHDSYLNRKMKHSINLMAVCTSRKIFTYVFIGFPGSAHDSRVFSNSVFVKQIEKYGPHFFFPDKKYHIIGDSAFPIKQWLITPYKKSSLSRIEKYHNYSLSSDRVCIEHTFGLLKGRYARLHYINTNSISKAIEIVTAACILHNFCFLNNDEWSGAVQIQEFQDTNTNYNINEDQLLGQLKRDTIAAELFRKK